VKNIEKKVPVCANQSKGLFLDNKNSYVFIFSSFFDDAFHVRKHFWKQQREKKFSLCRNKNAEFSIAEPPLGEVKENKLFF
jgi:hypothetical protein